MINKSQVEDWPSETKGWYVTFIFLFAFIFSLIDRQILNLLVIPIQNDLLLSDTQISLLQGFAFVITYVLLSVPIGRLVDKFNRIKIGGNPLIPIEQIFNVTNASISALESLKKRKWIKL